MDIAIAVVILTCLLLRAFGFAAAAVAYHLIGAIPFMYAVPLLGIAFGIYATTRPRRMRVPPPIAWSLDVLSGLARRLRGRDFEGAAALHGGRS